MFYNFTTSNLKKNGIFSASKVASQNFFKLKSKTESYYGIDNNGFNIAISQSWACVHFL